MKLSSVESSTLTYSAAISACEKVGRWEIALQLFDTMVDSRCCADTIAYNAAISACEKGGDWLRPQVARGLGVQQLQAGLRKIGECLRGLPNATARYRLFGAPVQLQSCPPWPRRRRGVSTWARPLCHSGGSGRRTRQSSSRYIRTSTKLCRRESRL
jgi:pentatricopeptide repeat protein